MTGFEAFGGARRNPAQRVAEALDGGRVADMRVRSVVLPCRFGVAPEALRRALRRHRPAVVVCLGLAGNRSEITPEALARNRVDARIPDNAGHQPRRQRINPRGPATRRTGLPVIAIAAELRRAGFGARVSRSAGSFVCNEVFYRLMEECPRRSGVRAGFIHVPPPGARGMTLAQLVRAVRVAIRVSITGKA